MSDMVVAAAQIVAGAVVQEVVSRTISLVLGKRKEKASQGDYLERLSKAVNEVEFVLERTAKLPITEVSLLREKIELKRDFIEATVCLLSGRHKKRQGQQETLSLQVVTRSSYPQDLATRPATLPLVSSLIATSQDDALCLSCDDVKRFERLADSARSILTRVESGCSQRRWMNFSRPLVSHLFAWKTLRYRNVQADQERHLEVWPAPLEEDRGVETVVRYRYLDHTKPDKSFNLSLVLRLSESTDIIGIVIKCLQSLASQFNLVADTAIGELTLLVANLQDISYSEASVWVGIQEWHSRITQAYRPYPLCCKGKGHKPCANEVVSTEISQAFPEEVIIFRFDCYFSAPEYSLRSSADTRGKRSLIMRNWRRPPLQLTVVVMPHFVYGDDEQASYAFEASGNNGDEHILDGITIQQMGETVRPRAINYFLRHPKTQYFMGWATKHGSACFVVEKQRAGVQVSDWWTASVNGLQ